MLDRLPFWNQMPPLAQKVLRFLTGGGAVALFRVIAATIMAELGFDPVWSYRVLLVVSFFLYFYLNLHFIFLVKDRLPWRLTKYTVVSVTFLSIDGWLVGWFHQDLGIHHTLSYCLSIGLLLLFKFVIYDKLVFQKTKS